MVMHPRLRVNEEITAPIVRVVDDTGVLGIMSISEALEQARACGQDLVQVAPNANPPVCQIIAPHRYQREPTTDTE